MFGFSIRSTTGVFTFLRVTSPIVPRTANDLADRMPPRAAADFVEWGPEPLAEGQFGSILNRELSLIR